MPSGSGSLVRPFWFSIARCGAEPNGSIGPKLSTNFRIGSGKAKSAIPIIPTTAAMTFGADSSLPSLALKEIRSIAHNPYGSPLRILHEQQCLEWHLSQPPAREIETKIVVQRKELHRPVRATKPGTAETVGNCRFFRFRSSAMQIPHS
jgi:hypothetical protein